MRFGGRRGAEPEKSPGKLGPAAVFFAGNESCAEGQPKERKRDRVREETWRYSGQIFADFAFEKSRVRRFLPSRPIPGKCPGVRLVRLPRFLSEFASYFASERGTLESELPDEHQTPWLSLDISGKPRN